MINLDYPDLLTYISQYKVDKRTESASFLIWYLENYYRLDPQDAVDCVCDQFGDKGVDGIYINETSGTIDVFQSKISQSSNKTIGDTALKEFAGSLLQLKDRESIAHLLTTSGDAQIVGLINRLKLMDKISDYKLRGVFISNINIDNNGETYLAQNSNIEFVGKKKLESTYISTVRLQPQSTPVEFDLSGVESLKFYADANTVTYIAPVLASELVSMPGIADQSIFDFNVRGPLGNTSINKGIITSIKNKEDHKNFPLFHNGITIVADIVNQNNDKIEINSYFVVNGCQSLSALYNNRSFITSDLRVLTKIIKVSVNSDLASKITEFSNRQNGVKARDFKSYNPIQVRLQNEVRQFYGSEFFFQIKRGEVSPQGLSIISNEDAGIWLMAFNLKEPWGTHRKYQVFEELYNDIYAKPDVTSDKIILLSELNDLLNSKLEDIKNKLVSKYILTKYFLFYIVRLILENDNIGKDIINAPENYVRNPLTRKKVMQTIARIIDEVIVDINLEFDELPDDFDYRSKLRDETWVKDEAKNFVGTFLKLVKSNRTNSIEKEWQTINSTS